MSELMDRGWGGVGLRLRPVWMLALLVVLAGLGRADYVEREDSKTNKVTEPVLASGTKAVPLPAGEFPYYGNVPEEMRPYRNLQPHFQYWLTRVPYLGPGKDYPDPSPLRTLRVGLLSPPPYGPEAVRGDMSKKGVMLAMEEANARKTNGAPAFELIEKADTPQWGSAANIAVDFADTNVLAIIGTIDGDATHVALRVALKIETYMVNCSDPDPSLTETQIPWLIRNFPDNRQQGYLLARVVVEERHLQRIVVLRGNSRPGRMGVRPFVDAVRRLGHPVLQELNFKEGERAFETQVAVIQQASPDAVVFWGNPEETGPAAVRLRAAGIKAAFFGFDRVVDPEFVKLAGAAAEGMTAAYFFDPDKTDALWTDFSRRFQKRFGMKPDIYAGYGFDGARMLCDVIDEVGPNRYRIRDRMASINEYRGVTGPMKFDGRSDNIAPIVLAEFHQGHWRYTPDRARTRSVSAAR